MKLSGYDYMVYENVWLYGVAIQQQQSRKIRIIILFYCFVKVTK